MQQYSVTTSLFISFCILLYLYEPILFLPLYFLTSGTYCAHGHPRRHSHSPARCIFEIALWVALKLFFISFYFIFLLNVHRISKMKRPILNIISRRKGYTSFPPVLIPIYVAKKRGSHVCCSWYRAHTNVELNIHYGLLRVLSYASGRRRVHIYCALYILLFSSLSFQTIRK